MATTLLPAGQDRMSAKLRIRELEEQLAQERALLADPVEPVGMHSVIRFVKYNQKYTFAAIKAYTDGTGQGVWFITQDGSRSSRQGHPQRNWDGMLSFIGERNWANIEVLG